MLQVLKYVTPEQEDADAIRLASDKLQAPATAKYRVMLSDGTHVVGVSSGHDEAAVVVAQGEVFGPRPGPLGALMTALIAGEYPGREPDDLDEEGDS
jgi:hypothetical protein